MTSCRTVRIASPTGSVLPRGQPSEITEEAFLQVGAFPQDPGRVRQAFIGFAAPLAVSRPGRREVAPAVPDRRHPLRELAITAVAEHGSGLQEEGGIDE